MNRTNLITIIFIAAMVLGVSGSLMAADRAKKKLPPISRLHFFVASGHLNLHDKFITGPNLEPCDVEGRKRYKIWKNKSEIQIIMFSPFEASWLLKNYTYQVVSIKDVSNDSIKYGLLQYCGIRSIKEVRANLIP